MRQVFFSPPPRNQNDAFAQWVMACLDEVRDASQDDIGQIANDFTLSNFTVTRTLNASTATTTDVANVLATFISDLRNRGGKRSQ